MIILWAKIYKLILRRNQLSASIRAELANRCLSPLEKYFKNTEDEYQVKSMEQREMDKQRIGSLIKQLAEKNLEIANTIQEESRGASKMLFMITLLKGEKNPRKSFVVGD